MTRIALPDPASLTGWQRAQYDRFPSGLSQALVLLDERLAGALPATANALRAASIDPAWREAIILRVAALLHNDYERFQHLEQARQQGWTKADIAAIETADSELPSDLLAVLLFVDALVAGSGVSDSVLESVCAVIDDRGLVTVIVLVGRYSTVANITTVLGIPLDDHPDSWTNEH